MEGKNTNMGSINEIESCETNLPLQTTLSPVLSASLTRNKMESLLSRPASLWSPNSNFLTRQTPLLGSRGHSVGSVPAPPPPKPPGGWSSAPSLPLSSSLWLSLSDDFQNIAGHEASLLSTRHSDEATVLTLATHTDLREEKCDLENAVYSETVQHE